LDNFKDEHGRVARDTVMGWEDRPYYRDPGDTTGNPLMWLLNGSVPLMTVFGIRVRIHATLLLTAVLMLVLPLGNGFGIEDHVIGAAMLFVIVLLHEFGHCFAARWVGGSADDIMMTPLGGLALAQPPRRWLPTFITAAGGPAVNVAICVGCGALLWALTAEIPLNPFRLHALDRTMSFFDIARYAYWIFVISYSLLLFNLLPIYPLDGGQIMQSLLWPKFGYYRSMIWACVIGMVGSALMLMFGIALAVVSFLQGLFLGLIAVSCFMYCMSRRRQLLADGPEEFADETDYSAAYEPATPRRRVSKLNRRAILRARRAAQEARDEQERIDQILAKVSAHGIASLTWGERRALRKATEHRRKRDLEVSK
jgi:Zn-dependent protease